MADIIYKEEAYMIVGKCIEVHRTLGKGFLEIVNKDALVYEFRNSDIPFAREKEYLITYKDIILPHNFFAAFVVFDKIILKIKSCVCITNEHIAQTLNYLVISNNKLALLVNFGQERIEYKRLVL